MNRTMKAKNDKRKRLEQKAKKEKFYDVASHRYYAEELPVTTSFFAEVDCTRYEKPWWDV